MQQYQYVVLSTSRARKYVDPTTGEPRYRLDITKVTPMHKATVAERAAAGLKPRPPKAPPDLPEVISIKGSRYVRMTKTGKLRLQTRTFAAFADLRTFGLPAKPRGQVWADLEKKRDAWVAGGVSLAGAKPSLL